jgi:hypothetical protein
MNAIHPNSSFPESPGDGFSYQTYDRLTRAYVDEQGRVDYAGLKAEIATLRGFIEQLAAVCPESRPDLFATEDDRKRYYLTAYNALVLYFAASAYPNRHALWSRLGYFKNKDIVLGGRKLTLNELENNIIRRQFLDPRIHFYINCGAKGCPALNPGAIAQNATEAELDQAARRFINDPTKVRFDAENATLYLSRIFDWFSEDFIRYLKVKRGLQRPHISQYLTLYLAGSAGQALSRVPPPQVKIKYLDYEKDLNGQ